MITADQFKDYSATQLATEALFISWVKCPDESNDIFWKEYVEKYPLQRDVVNKASLIVNEMKIIQPNIDAAKEAETWNAINEKIGKVPSFKVYRSLNIRRVAAAIFIIVLGAGGYFILSNKTVDKLAKTENILQQDRETEIAPGGNRAVLTLANGSTIILDSAQNGTLSSQGNIKIIKLDDGQLAYDRSGSSPLEEAEVGYNTISTPKGGQYQVTLSDGSKVWLNAESSLKFPSAFPGEERKVELTGEGYFEVAHNKEKPFIVTANKTNVEVLGTHFNINAYPDENMVKATLLEGSVKVKKGKESKVITPGEQAAVNNSSGLIQVQDDANLDAAVAWKNGKFYFDKADIKTIMNQVSRWYNVEVEYKGTVSKIFAGTISRNVSASNVFKILEATGGVHFTIEGKKVIVEPAS